DRPRRQQELGGLGLRRAGPAGTLAAPGRCAERTKMDFATRAWNHSFPFDPIVRSLLDTDFYKLLMQQLIWEEYPNVQVSWKLTNRTKTIRLRSEEHTSELQSRENLVCRLLLEKK